MMGSITRFEAHDGPPSWKGQLTLEFYMSEQGVQDLTRVPPGQLRARYDAFAQVIGLSHQALEIIREAFLKLARPTRERVLEMLEQELNLRPAPQEN